MLQRDTQYHHIARYVHTQHHIQTIRPLCRPQEMARRCHRSQSPLVSKIQLPCLSYSIGKELFPFSLFLAPVASPQSSPPACFSWSWSGCFHLPVSILSAPPSMHVLPLPTSIYPLSFLLNICPLLPPPSLSPPPCFPFSLPHFISPFVPEQT